MSLKTGLLATLILITQISCSGRDPDLIGQREVSPQIPATAEAPIAPSNERTVWIEEDSAAVVIESKFPDQPPTLLYQAVAAGDWLTARRRLIAISQLWPPREVEKYVNLVADKSPTLVHLILRKNKNGVRLLQLLCRAGANFEKADPDTGHSPIESAPANEKTDAPKAERLTPLQQTLIDCTAHRPLASSVDL